MSETECECNVTKSWFPLLQPANEVWGKVMFLHLSVILFMGGGQWGRHRPGQTPPLWADPPPDTMGYGQQVGSMHPTGMHTCL